MEYEEYLHADLPERTEWVDGEVVPMMAVSEAHARLVGWLARLLGGYVEARDLGELFLEPFQMKTGPDLPGRAPDIIFLRREHVGRVRKLYLDGPADVVIEVVSPGSEDVDRGAKFYEYERGGVPEYWLLDPERETAEFFVRDEKGVFRAVPLDNGVYRSRNIEGLELPVDWLWQRPPVLRALRELGVA